MLSECVLNIICIEENQRPAIYGFFILSGDRMNDSLLLPDYAKANT